MRVRAPAAVVALPFVAGMAAGAELGFFVAMALAAVFLTGLLALALFAEPRRGLTATGLLLAAYFFLGAAARSRAELSVERQPLLQLYQSSGDGGFPHPCRLTGILREDPVSGLETVQLWMRVHSVHQAGVTRAAGGQVRVHVRGDPERRRSLRSLRAGDRISLWARLSQPRRVRK